LEDVDGVDGVLRSEARVFKHGSLSMHSPYKAQEADITGNRRR